MQEINAYIDLIAINEIRSILANDIEKPNCYLPVTLAALILAEGARYNASFLAIYILLDLMEAKVKLPDHDDYFNFANLLSNPETRNEFIDAHQAKYCTIAEVGRNIGGYHPMAHTGSFDEQENRNKDKLVTSQQKLANILFQWLELQLKESSFKTTLDKKFIDQACHNINDIQQDIADKLIKPLMRARISQFDFMGGQSRITQTITKKFYQGQFDISNQNDHKPSSASTSNSWSTITKELVINANELVLNTATFQEVNVISETAHDSDDTVQQQTSDLINTFFSNFRFYNIQQANSQSMDVYDNNEANNEANNETKNQKIDNTQ
jgi:hypothetical protein